MTVMLKTQINLLHPEMQPRFRLSFLQQSILVMVVAGFVAVLAVTSLWLQRVDAARELQINSAVQEQLSGQLRSAAREYQQMSDISDDELRIERYTQQVAELDRQLKLFEQAELMDAGDINELLSSLDEADVPGLWLTQMVYVRRHLVLTGRLVDSKVLPQWLSNMERSVWFDDRVFEQLQLVADNRNESGSSEVSQFMLIEQGFKDVIEQADTSTQFGAFKGGEVSPSAAPMVNNMEIKP